LNKLIIYLPVSSAPGQFRLPRTRTRPALAPACSDIKLKWNMLYDYTARVKRPWSGPRVLGYQTKMEHVIRLHVSSYTMAYVFSSARFSLAYVFSLLVAPKGIQCKTTHCLKQSFKMHSSLSRNDAKHCSLSRNDARHSSLSQQSTQSTRRGFQTTARKTN
jgi:hypothetical protein